MKLRTVGYFARQAGISIWRNGWMSLATIVSVGVSMFILGAFLLLVFNINYVSNNLKSNVEIAAFLPVDAPREFAIEIQGRVETIPGVDKVSLVTKEEGLKQLSPQFGGEAELMEATGGINPLPDYLRVKVVAPETIHDVAAAISAIPGVEKVNYGQEIVDRLFTVAKMMQLLGTGIVLLLAFGAFCLIVITIRLTVYSRWREINIMKYVGATDWFIRWPFFLEGLFLGILGSGLATVLVYWSYSLLLGRVGAAFIFVPLIRDPGLLMYNSLILITGGALVGSLGSMLSVRRFLKV